MKTEGDPRGRVRLVMVICAALFLVLEARLWQLQVIRGSEYTRLSMENQLNVEKIPAPRGIIYDRNGKELVKNSAFFSIAILPEKTGTVDIKAVSELIFVPADEILRKIESEKNSIEPIKLKEGLSFVEVAFLESRLSDFPALSIQAEQSRSYPYAEVGAHLVGYLGKLGPAQASHEAFKDVPKQAFVGQWGIEKMFDRALRGTPGQRVTEVDALGRQLKVVRVDPPQKGEDIYLSIDIEMQRVAAEAFGDRAGAFVAIRPATGEVLGLISSPSFDPNLFARGVKYEDWVRLANGERYPLLNRALQSQYPPGSTFKIVTAIAALETGAITPEKTTTCTGGLRRGRWDFGCWKRGGHGTLPLRRAIVESCDVYFYTAGELAQIDNIAKYARLLGLGGPTGLDLVEEKTGLIPDTKWKLQSRGEAWFPGETFNASIGQGYVLVTPAQQARMISAVANGGYLHELRLRKSDATPSDTRLNIDEETLATVKDALMGVVRDPHGTGYAARTKVVSIGGKTGTSQVIAKRENIEKLKEIPYMFRDHAWFVAFAPEENPEIAVSVFVEHGGHGGDAAAPIARKAIETYINNLRALEGGDPPDTAKGDGA